LLLATFGIYQSLGAPLAIGIGLMLLAGLTLTPALLAIFGGGAVFWPSKPQRGVGKVGVWGRVSAKIVRHPAVTLTVGLVVFGGLAVAVSGYQAAGFGSALSAPSGSDGATGNSVIDAHFPKSASNPTNVLFTLRTSAWDDPAVLTTAHDELAASPVFNGVTGPLNPNGAVLTGAQLTQLHSRLGAPNGLSAVPPAGVDATEYQAYRATANYLSANGLTVQFYTSLTARDPSTTSALHVVPQIRAAVTKVAHDIGATNSGVAWEAPGIYDVSAHSNHDLKKVVPVAIIVIGLLLALVMRSAVAPLYLIASVALSYLAALGLSVIIFQGLFNSGGLTFILPFLMFLFLLALGEDYNILVMSRIREEAHDLPLREAVARALTATGSTVTSAGLVLAGTFAVFAVAAGAGAGSSQIRDVGVGLTIGIGRWNWWPSSLGRRHDELAELEIDTTSAS
jgi:RND superfamily putative drug exporter